MTAEQGALSDERPEPEDPCDYQWGWHNEHWCEEDKSHPLEQHFCPCGEEKDLHPPRPHPGPVTT